MKMAIEIKKSHEGRFHEWANVPNGQENSDEQDQAGRALA
jgi:hypothetical protein